jgi:hypothetical protein
MKPWNAMELSREFSSAQNEFFDAILSVKAGLIPYDNYG